MENNIKYLTKTFQKMGKLEILEADHQFNTKLFRDFNFGIPQDIQFMLDIDAEEFNNHFHKGIKTTSP